jgi:hypothetical protein
MSQNKKRKSPRQLLAQAIISTGRRELLDAAGAAAAYPA